MNSVNKPLCKCGCAYDGSALFYINCKNMLKTKMLPYQERYDTPSRILPIKQTANNVGFYSPEKGFNPAKVFRQTREFVIFNKIGRVPHECRNFHSQDFVYMLSYTYRMLYEREKYMMHNGAEKKIESLRRTSNFLEAGLYVLLHKTYFGLQMQKNIRYMPLGKRTYLDIIQAKISTRKKRPLLIYIHGGGWVSGLRQARRFYCKHWAKEGFVCANIGYDYANDATHPKHIQQIFKGIEYVLAHADTLDIDTDRVVVAGESAGGYFAALVGAVTTHKKLYDLLQISFSYKNTFRVHACILMSGIFDPARALDTHFQDMEWFTEALCAMPSAELKGEKGQEIRHLLAPSYYADAQFPPSFIIGSAKDLLLPESMHFHNELDAAGVQNTLYICDGLNSMHAGALACHLGTGKTAVREAQTFVEAVWRAAHVPEESMQ